MKEKWGSPRGLRRDILRFSWLSLFCDHGRLDTKNVAVYVLR